MEFLTKENDCTVILYKFVQPLKLYVMKNLIFILVALVPMLVYGQFKVSTMENRSGIETVATCSSKAHNTWASKSTFQIGKLPNGKLYMALFFQPMSMNSFGDKDSYYDKLNIILNLYDSKGNKQHTYYSNTNGYDKTNKGYWLYIYDDKIVKYFKKYSTVVIGVEDSVAGLFKYEFSLSGFTSAVSKVLK
jgi:hypothetical protein